MRRQGAVGEAPHAWRVRDYPNYSARVEPPEAQITHDDHHRGAWGDGCSGWIDGDPWKGKVLPRSEAIARRREYRSAVAEDGALLVNLEARRRLSIAPRPIAESAARAFREEAA